ncbi:MAG: DUF2812 domain-containing protein [Oscillospiraceae bacterium]|nr:DUF2812 domain-containing protein [Oscillospiraceae bacterium]
MKETKRRMELYSFYDRTGMERHLAEMAEKGWLLEKIGQFLWTYKAIEPKRLTFSVTYFPAASQFDPRPSEEQETFYDFCAHTGWVLAAANAQMQIFYNEGLEPIPIGTDPVQEVALIHRTMKKSFLPAQLLLLAVGLLNGWMFLSELRRDLIGTLSNTSRLFSVFCFILVILLAAAELGTYFYWHRKAATAAEQGDFYETRGHKKLQAGAFLLLGLVTVWYLLRTFTGESRMMRVLTTLMFLVYVPGIFLLVNGIKAFLKKRGVSAGVNRAVTMGGSFVLAMALVFGITFLTLYGSSHGWFKEPDEETYVAGGHTWTASNDPLPLTVEKLTGDDREGYDRQLREESSFLLAHMEVDERPRFDVEGRKDMYWLDYEVVLVKVPGLYESCWEQLFHERDHWNDGEPEEEWNFYAPVDPAPWGAERAYRWDGPLGPGSRYLLGYRDRIVEIELDEPEGTWAPTGEQMTLVGEKLGN